jgi:hypothetical protein
MSRVWILRGAGGFILATKSRLAMGLTEAPIELLQGVSSLRVSRQKREADYLAQYSAEVKNAWSYTFFPPCTFRRGA